MNRVLIQERGWGGHFICANRCRFRRNTLLTCGNIRVVVSTVGALELIEGRFSTVGHNRNYETMAFMSDDDDHRFHDADVTRQIYFNSDWAIEELDADDRANDMHNAVVREISDLLVSGAFVAPTKNRD